MSSYADAILRICPAAQFSIINDDLARIEWIEGDYEKPTTKEIEESRKFLDAEEERSAYQQKRRDAYPDFGELADALYWANRGDDSHLQEYFAKCSKVKELFPKEQAE